MLNAIITQYITKNKGYMALLLAYTPPQSAEKVNHNYKTKLHDTTLQTDTIPANQKLLLIIITLGTAVAFSLQIESLNIRKPIDKSPIF